jgi:NADH-quinone oxidoreductase subunit I
MMFDKEKLLSVFDQTTKMGTDPVRTHRGKLGPASEPAASGLPPSSTAQSF